MPDIFNLGRTEAVSWLNELRQSELVQIGKQLNVTMGSKRTKSELIKQIIWHVFDAIDELERIRSYKELTK